VAQSCDVTCFATLCPCFCAWNQGFAPVPKLKKEMPVVVCDPP
jgi:hypothetical protein